MLFRIFLLQVFKLREIRYSFSIRVYKQSPADKLPSRFLGNALYHIPTVSNGSLGEGAFDILVAQSVQTGP